MYEQGRAERCARTPRPSALFRQRPTAIRHLQGADVVMDALPNRVIHAPEFREGLDWIGTDRPLRIADLRGRVVLLDFWTYG
jgi:hypothetical protein